MYADDIVILGETHSNTQDLLDILSAWCFRWGMKANIKKSQVIHHRNPQRPRHETQLRLMNQNMEYVSEYKYLGCWVSEFSSTYKTVSALTAAASRSYGRIVGMFKHLGDMGYRTFCTLYHSYVEPIANYAAAVWGFRDHSAPRVLQNRRFYLGVHRFAPVSATSI